MQCYRILIVVAIAVVSTQGGLLRVPKIYNTVITSDANLEPSRSFPIVQPVLSLGVQSVIPGVAVPAVSGAPLGPPGPPGAPGILHQRGDQPDGHYYQGALGGQQPPAGTAYYPYDYGYGYALGGIYPFLAPNLVYPTSVLYQPPYGSEVEHAPAAAPPAVAPASRAGNSAPAVPPAAQENIPPAPIHNHVPDSSHHHADPFNNSHRFKNPGIPDVPPPPLPVRMSRSA